MTGIRRKVPSKETTVSKPKKVSENVNGGVKVMLTPLPEGFARILSKKVMRVLFIPKLAMYLNRVEFIKFCLVAKRIYDLNLGVGDHHDLNTNDLKKFLSKINYF